MRFQWGNDQLWFSFEKNARLCHNAKTNGYFYQIIYTADECIWRNSKVSVYWKYLVSRKLFKKKAIGSLGKPDPYIKPQLLSHLIVFLVLIVSEIPIYT